MEEGGWDKWFKFFVSARRGGSGDGGGGGSRGRNQLLAVKLHWHLEIRDSPRDDALVALWEEYSEGVT